jgi:hypothetical protein
MTDRIREIAQVYAANAGEVEALYNAILELVRDDREACIRLITNSPWANPTELADAIRARKP